MKGRRSLWVVLAVSMALPSLALASYVSIQHNLIEGTGDTSYINGVLTVNATGVPAQQLTLNDDPPIAQSVSNVSVLMTTNFSSFNPGANLPYGEALFTGGSFLLKFDYAGSSGQPYQIGGPISAFVIGIGSASQYLTVINGSGLFNAGTPNLPGSNVWPAGGLSSINSLTLEVGIDLTGFDWDPYNAVMTGGETQYTLTPDDSGVPEPAGLLLVLCSAVFALRRR